MAKKATKKINKIFIQFSGNEVTTNDLTRKVKEILTKDLGNLVWDMKHVKIYVNTDKSKVYYVINDTVTGDFEI